MSVIFFFFYVYITTYFAVIFVSLRHRYINVDVPNIHTCTHVSAVHSLSDAVSLVFVSDGFANTNIVQRGDIHILPLFRVVAVAPVLYQDFI